MLHRREKPSLQNSQTDLDAPNSELSDVVRETLQPTHMSLWLKDSSD
jgi:hypothetical protein